MEKGCANCGCCSKAAEDFHEQAKMEEGYKVPSNAIYIDVPSDDDGRVNKAKRQRTVRKKDKKLKRITFRGLCTKGGKEYDKHCKFRNDVEMTLGQVAFLIDKVAAYKPCIPYYVCKMTNSNFNPGKAKMYFSTRYTDAHLKQYLPKEIPVICTERAVVEDVRFIVGKNGVAQMTTNWPNVLEAAKIREGDLCIFTFFVEELQGFTGHIVCLN